MIAQLVIVFYFIVCVGIIIFNCFTEIISRYRSCVLKRREQRYCEEYRQLFLENITENKKPQIASSSWTPSGRKLGLPQPLRLRKQCQGMLQRVLLECSTPDSSSEGC